VFEPRRLSFSAAQPGDLPIRDGKTRLCRTTVLGRRGRWRRKVCWCSRASPTAYIDALTSVAEATPHTELQGASSWGPPPGSRLKPGNNVARLFTKTTLNQIDLWYCEFRLYLGILTYCINRPLTIPKSFLTIAQTPIVVLKRDNSRKTGRLLTQHC
jgi:hypothetical protein